MTRYIKAATDEDIIVLRDDREKQPWDHGFEEEIKRLKVGDYSFKNYEHIVAIEKKSGIQELLTDLTMRYRETFKRFLRKMEAHPVSCIIVQEELTEYNIRRALKIIKEKSKGRCQLTSGTIHHWVPRIMAEYGIPILFLDWRLIDVMLPEIFKQSYRKAQELR